MYKISDRVKESSITQGSGNILLSGPHGGFESFADSIGDGNTTVYAIENGIYWEVGQGTYSSSNNSLSRDVVFDSSNNGAKINLTGASVVFCTMPAAKSVIKDDNDDIYISGIFADSGVISQLSGVTFQGETVFNDILASGDVHIDEGFFTITTSESGGSFFHGVRSGPSDHTVSLHVNDSQNDPLWKLGLKSSSSDSYQDPDYSYIYGRGTTAGIANDSGNYFQIGAGFGFAVTTNYHNTFIASSDNGVSVSTNNVSNPVFVIEKSIGSPQDLQQWQDAGGTAISVVDSNGQFGVLKTDPLYPLDVSSSGRIGNIILTNSGVYFSDGTFQPSAASDDTAISISGYFQDYVDSQDHSAAAVSGWADATIVHLSGWADTTITNGDNAVSGWVDSTFGGVFFSGNPSGVAFFDSSGTLTSSAGFTYDGVNTVTLKDDATLLEFRGADDKLALAIGDAQTNTNEGGIIKFYSQGNTVGWISSSHAGITHRIQPNDIIAIEDGNNFEYAKFYGTTTDKAFEIVSPASTAVLQTYVGAATQSANLTEWQNDLGTVLAYVDSGGSASFKDLTVDNMTVSGMFTYVNSQNVTIADKQLELASNSGTAISGDAWVDQGGIVLKSTDGDKQWVWDDATDAWTSNQNVVVQGTITNPAMQTFVSNSTAFNRHVYPSNINQNLGLDSNRWDTVYTNNLDVSGILYASGDPGTADQVLTSTADGIEWRDANTLAGLSGTPSGIAFFGDDGLITDDSNFVFSSGDPLLKIRVSGDATNNVEWRIGEDPVGNSNAYHLLLAPNGTGSIKWADIGVGGVNPVHHRYKRDVFTLDSVVAGATKSSIGISSSFLYTNFYPNATASSHNLGSSSYIWGQVYGGKLISDIQNSTDVGVTIQGAAAQSANLTEWQNSSSETMTLIDASGDFVAYASGDSSSTYNRLRITNDGHHTFIKTESNQGVSPYQELTVRGGSVLRLYNDSDTGLYVGDYTVTHNTQTLRPQYNRFTNIGDATYGYGDLHIESIFASSGIKIFSSGDIAATDSEYFKIDTSISRVNLGTFGDGNGDGSDLYIYRDGISYLEFKLAGTQVIRNLIPNVDGNPNIGRTDLRFGSVYSWNLDAESHSTTGIPLKVKGAAAQFANLTEWQDSAGEIGLLVDSGRNIRANDKIIIRGSGDINSDDNYEGGVLEYYHTGNPSHRPCVTLYAQSAGSGNAFPSVRIQSRYQNDVNGNTGGCFEASYVGGRMGWGHGSTATFGQGWFRFEGTTVWGNTSWTTDLGGPGGNYPFRTLFSSGVVTSGLLLHEHVPADTNYQLYNDGGTLKWDGSPIGGSVSGTPSGVAFFGDDGLITDTSNLFIRQSGNYGNHVQIAVNADPSVIPANSPDKLLALHMDKSYRQATLELKHTTFGNARLDIIAASGGRSAGIKMSNGTNNWYVGPQNSNVSMGAGTTLVSSYNLDTEKTLAFDNNGRLTIGGVYASAALHVNSYSTTLGPVSIFKGKAAQSTNLSEWQDDASTVLASVGPDGSISTSGTITLYGSGVIGSSEYEGARLEVVPTGNSNELRIGTVKDGTGTAGGVRIYSGFTGANQGNLQVGPFGNAGLFYGNTAYLYNGGGYLRFQTVDPEPYPSMGVGLGKVDRVWKHIHVADTHVSGILYASGDPGTADQVLTSTADGIEWRDANTLAGLSGTPSGVAFFGDDGLITDESAFVYDSGNSRLGLGTAVPEARLDITGNTTSDHAELTTVSIAGKTGSGTNWSGTDVEAGYTHTAGSSDPLVTNITPVINTRYAITYTTSGVSAGRFDFIDFGGVRKAVYNAVNKTETITLRTINNSDPLELTPRSDFAGTVSIDSIKTVGTRDAIVSIRRSDGVLVNEIRTGTGSSQPYNSIYMGYQAGQSASGVGGSPANTAVGYRALENNVDGGYNTVLGWLNAVICTEQSYLTLVGHRVLPYVRSISKNLYNTAMGTNIAYGNNFTGGVNILIGNNIFTGATTAGNNVVVGYNAMRDATTNSYNVALGNQALQSFTTGGSNTAIGSLALISATTGSYNIAIGRQAGRYYGAGTTNLLTDADNSILIGYNSRPSGDAETNQIVIGHEAIGNGSDSVTLGNTSITKTVLYGDVGIDTSSPDAKLHAAATNATDVGIIAQGAATQTANLTEWQNSANEVLAHVDSGGSIFTSGDISASGSLGASRFMASDDGSLAAPAFSFDSQTNMGIYRTAGNQLNFACGANYGINLSPYSLAVTSGTSFSWRTGNSLSGGHAFSTQLHQEANGVIGQYSEYTLEHYTPQQYNIYNYWGGNTSNWERLEFKWEDHTAKIQTAALGSGVRRNIHIEGEDSVNLRNSAGALLYCGGSSRITVYKDLVPHNDGSTDLGVSNRRWDSIWGEHLNVKTDTATNVVSTFAGTVSQTANLTEWQNSDGDTQVAIDPSGRLNIYASGDTGAANALSLYYQQSGDDFVIGPSSSTGFPKQLFLCGDADNPGRTTVHIIESTSEISFRLSSNTAYKMSNTAFHPQAATPRSLGVDATTNRWSALYLGDHLGTTNATLVADSGHTLALRSGTNAQQFNVYNTYTDASNYERLEVKWDTNEAQIKTTAAGTGTQRALTIGTPNINMSFYDGSSIQVDEDFYCTGATNNTLNLGTQSRRWGNTYSRTVRTDTIYNTSIQTHTATGSVNQYETMNLVDATSGAVTLTLPATLNQTGLQMTFKKIDASANIVTISPNGAETIDGQSSYVVNNQYESITLVSDGSNWFII